jgi:hypothetical protein
MSYRTAAWLAWSLWGLALTLTALALLLLTLILSHPNTHVRHKRDVFQLGWLIGRGW